ncbi:hypothetical protein F5I97DRAFT_37605 [Phlebopus sp. FC_14]|nr:hypothetical protein F5I97DRAFT_37605 [Phlebopus sp. FC_14]
MSPADTLKTARLASLFFSFAFSVIGGSVGLNALVKYNQDRSRVNDAAPAGAVVTINVHDVFSTGAVITAVCALLAVLSAIFFIFIWCPLPAKRVKFYLRIQSCALLFCSLWLLATLIPFDYYFANRQVGVSVTLDGVPVPASLIQALEEALGFTPVYKDIYYLRLVAVLPWFSFLFPSIASIVFHIAARRVGEGAPSDESKYEPGGEFHPDWESPMPRGPPPDAPQPPPEVPPPPEDIQPARPAWRSVRPRRARIWKLKPEAPPPEPVAEPRQATSWGTRQPNAAFAPTPPSVEPTLFVSDRGSPGLFGPRSPRSSYHP